MQLDYIGQTFSVLANCISSDQVYADLTLELYLNVLTVNADEFREID